MRLFVQWFVTAQADKPEAKRISQAVVSGEGLDAWLHWGTRTIDGMDLNKLEGLLRPKEKGKARRLGGKHLLGMDPDKPIISHVTAEFLEKLVSLGDAEGMVAKWNEAEGLEKVSAVDLRGVLDHLIQMARQAHQSGREVVQVDLG